MSTPGDTEAAELRATYRLQLTSAFGFGSARTLVPYLRDLGISHLYLSPSFQARPESTHGYDVVDPSRLSDALGGQAEFERLSAEARNAGMGIVLDIVPNHMAADEVQPLLGRSPSCGGSIFDIDEATGHYRRFFDIDDLAAIRQEDPGGLRDHTRARPVAPPRRADRRAARRSPRWTGRPGWLSLSGWPPGALSGSGWRRSSTRASGCGTGRCPGRWATSS